MNPIKIITYIVWYATHIGIKLTTNRLVKFIYLADLYHARIKGGQTLSGFPWRFIYYGPYCKEAMKSIDEAVTKGYICKETYDSSFDEKKEYSLFWCKGEDAEELEEFFHTGILGKLQGAIKRFGQDTPQLLDYVYFETEPMQNAQQGDLLDFSIAKLTQLGKTIKLKELSPDTVRKAREKIKKLSDELKDNRNQLLRDEQEIEKYKDESYCTFLKYLDDSELKTGLKGVAKIKVPK